MKIKVKAAEGRMVHFPLAVKAAPGAKTLCISGDTVVEVDSAHRYIRRRLRVGDLVLVKIEKAIRKTTPKKDA